MTTENVAIFEEATFQDVCRICMQTDENLIPIFNFNQFTNKKSLAEMLAECIRYRVLKDDKLPKNICQMCMNQVEDAYALKSKAEESYRRLCEIYYKEECDSSANLNIAALEALEKSIQTESFCEVNPFTLMGQQHFLQGNKYFCQLCDKSFAQLSDLRSHMLKDHTGGQPPVQLPCPICPRTFSRKDHVKRHVVNVHKEDPNKYFTMLRVIRVEPTLECPICKRKLSRKDHLKRHISLIHKMDPNDVLMNSLEQIQNIMKQESQVAVFNEADWHDQLFFDKQPFKTENRLRDDRKNFFPMPATEIKLEPQYDVYDSRDGNESDYNDNPNHIPMAATEDFSNKRKFHAENEDEIKERTCQLCQRIFADISLLRYHMQSAHIPQKPYSCRYCSKCFAQNSDLRDHVRRHTGERYKCEQCNASFLQLYGLKQHALSAHGQDIDSSNKQPQKINSISANCSIATTFAETNDSNSEFLNLNSNGDFNNVEHILPV